MTVAAAAGPMTGMNTLTNSPSEPHLKAFRVDLRCSGESVGVLNVQDMSWSLRSRGGMLKMIE